jgi:hypothetical protein
MPGSKHRSGDLELSRRADRCRSMNPHPPKLVPVFGVMIHEKHTPRICLDVPDALEIGGTFRFQCVHRQDDSTAVPREHDGYGVDASRAMDRCEHPVADLIDELKARGFVQFRARRLSALSPKLDVRASVFEGAQCWKELSVEGSVAEAQCRRTEGVRTVRSCSPKAPL